LPPYIKQAAKLPDYQTVYAKTPGSVAAPTAGLHFTPALLKKLKRQGVQEEFVTLHVGLGTFQPVKAGRVEDHLIHSEWASISPATAQRLNHAKLAGRRIIAVGTTSARTLEAFSTSAGRLRSGSQNVQIFIYPPYRFKFVDALITIFICRNLPC
jgi:S-adenosylmethionine:tRNA ribosyltransferase-isomerase